MQQPAATDIKPLLHQAIAAHRAGDLASAEQHCRAALAVAPGQAAAVHHLAVLLGEQQRLGEALALFAQAVQTAPAQGQYWLNYAKALLATGQPHQGARVLAKACAGGLGGAAVETLAQQLREACAQTPDLAGLRALEQAGEFDRLLAQTEAAIGQFGERPALLQMRAAAWLGQGRAEEALALFATLCAREPDNVGFWNHRAVALKRLERLEEANDAYRAALRCAPEDHLVLANLGGNLNDQKRFDEALPLLEQALALAPQALGARVNLANCLLGLGRAKEAATLIDAVLAEQPALPEALMLRGRLLTEDGDLEEGIRALRTALAQRPEDAEIRLGLARALGRDGQTEPARELLLAVTASHPHRAEPWLALAELCLDIGEFAACESACQRALALEPTMPEAWAKLAFTRKQRTEDGDWRAQVEALLADASIAPERRMNLHYALGKFYDDTGDIDQAFAAYTQANRLKAARCEPYEPGSHEELVAHLMATYGREVIATQRTGAHASEQPVLIVGMPRSGTSLTEQIIASHPQACGAGELRLWRLLASRYPDATLHAHFDAESLGALSAAALRELERRCPGAARVVDKMPGNYLRLGVFHAVFPHGRIIHTQRHPLDTCLSIYCQNFNTGHVYANDLAELAHYYRQYHRLMAHWRAVLPAEVFLEVPYEALVEDQEGWSRRIIAFLGLEWDARCLEFHKTERKIGTASNWQARQPIYTTSKARWRRYEAHLGPLLGLLELVPEAAPPLTASPPASEPIPEPPSEPPSEPAPMPTPAAVAAPAPAPARSGKSRAQPVRRKVASSGQRKRHARLRALFAAGDWAAAEPLARQCLRKDKADVLAWQILGAARLNRDDPQEAATALERATRLDPTDAHGPANLGVAYRRLGRLTEAEASYREAIVRDQTLAAAPANLGRLLHAQERWDEAEACYRQALALAPNNRGVRLELGNILQDRGRLQEAEATYRELLERDPQSLDGLNNLGSVLRHLGRAEEAEAQYRAALALAPENPGIHANIAELLDATNQTEALRAHLAQVPAAAEAFAGIALARARQLRHDGQWEEASALLRAHDWSQSEQLHAACGALALLGELEDRLQRPAQAWAAFTAANATAARLYARHGVNRAPYVAQITQLRQVFRPLWVAQWRRLEREAAAPVFLVGFPRSGTTLLDTVLRSHPAVSVIEEQPTLRPLQAALAELEQTQGDVLGPLDEATADALRERYLSARARYDDHQGQRPVVIDKMPLNLIWAGHLARLFPQARFILALRHPCDCVLSCWMHHFQPNVAMASFLDLEQAAALYDQVMGLWQQYRALLPLQVHELRYEDLVAEFEPTVTGLLGFLGLAWDPAVLRYAETAQARGMIRTPSYNQVTQPIYTRASGRWERYREHLAPVLPVLLPWAAHFGYGGNGAAPAALAHPPAAQVAREDIVRLFEAGNLDEAETAARALTEQAPEHAFGWKALGTVLARRGQPQAARPLLEQALAIEPGAPDVLNTLAKVWDDLGDLEQAVAGYRQAVAADPKAAMARNNLGYALQRQGQLEEARAQLEQALALRADFPEAHNNLGMVLKDQGDWAAARAHFEQALRLKPDYVDALNNLGVMLKELGDTEGAVARYQEALRLQPDAINTLNNLGNIHKQRGEVEQALAYYEQVIERAPEFIIVHGNLCLMYEQANRLDDLRAAIERAPEAARALPHMQLAQGRLVRREGRLADARDILSAAVAGLRGRDVTLAAAAGAALGDVLDRLGESAGAFQAFGESNALAARVYQRLGVSEKAFFRQLDQLEAVFSAGDVAGWTDAPRSDPEASAPVFLVGFPRSGTTLLDTILRSHPQVAVVEERPALNAVVRALNARHGGYPQGLGALDQDQLLELRGLYRETLASFLDEQERQRPVWIDKLPLNIVHVGLIQRLFPEARIILALRHPCDCVLSCFMHHFEPNPAMAPFLTLEGSAAFYDRVMRLWRRYDQVLPLRAFPSRYEDLVADFNGTVGALLDFLELPWCEEVTRYRDTALKRGRIKTPSYHQVVEPIYQRAAGRWAQYREPLEPVLPVLSPWVERFGYAPLAL